MARSQESFNKKEVRNKKEKKRKDKEQKRLDRRSNTNSNSFDDMIAYVDENGRISSTPPDPGSRKKVNIEDIEISVPKRSEDEKPNPMRKGILTFYNDSKGYGFIRDLENQQSIFAHVNDFEDDIKENNKVSFEIEMGNKGPKAVRVKLDK